LNRWREQMSLPPQEKDELLKAAKSLKVAGQEAHYVDYATPAGKELKGESQRISAPSCRWPTRNSSSK